MRIPIFVLLIALNLAGGLPAAAERNLIPSLSSEPDVCADRPEEPDWMEDIGVRDAYKRVLVHDIYRAQNLERIVASGTCACETRFPIWDEAEAEFRDRFASAERWEMLEASDDYNRRANTLRPDAMAICQAEGNW
ncbi:hypothetical protein [Salipiger thiooxidans]|uniref:hypothetical protein n=1 Tax=Salipiger thiooxidans TaxID=282683 RepID=UPI001CFBF0EE|nr:hypothetical protein [Salipiger thiooxidans]